MNENAESACHVAITAPGYHNALHAYVVVGQKRLDLEELDVNSTLERKRNVIGDRKSVV